MGPHDIAFRKLLKEEGAAEALLRERLPPALIARFAGPPQHTSESFIDESSRGALADVVLRVKLCGGDEAYVYCLIEHKRTPEDGVLVQALRYMTALYAHLAKTSRSRPLPAVVPLIIYNGRTRWRGPRRFSALVDLPAALRHLTIDFEVLLLDLGAEPISSMSSHAKPRGGLLALKAAATAAAALPEVLKEMISSLEGESTLGWFLEYLGKVSGQSMRASIEHVKQEFEGKEETMQTLEQYLKGQYQVGLKKGIARGLAKGLEKGLEKGLVKGRAEVAAPLRKAVRLLLTARFKRVPTSLLRRVEKARIAQLEGWLAALDEDKPLKDIFPPS